MGAARLLEQMIYTRISKPSTKPKRSRASSHRGMVHSNAYRVYNLLVEYAE